MDRMADPTYRADVVIIGGGLAGIVTALELIDQRKSVVRKSAFTKGVVKVNFGRFSLRQKLRFLGRAMKRHVLVGD